MRIPIPGIGETLTRGRDIAELTARNVGRLITNRALFNREVRPDLTDLLPDGMELLGLYEIEINGEMKTISLYKQPQNTEINAKWAEMVAEFYNELGQADRDSRFHGAVGSEFKKFDKNRRELLLGGGANTTNYALIVGNDKDDKNAKNAKILAHAQSALFTLKDKPPETQIEEAALTTSNKPEQETRIEELALATSNKPEHRRRGLGRLMLEAIARDAQKRTELLALNTLKSNKAANRLIEKVSSDLKRDSGIQHLVTPDADNRNGLITFWYLNPPTDEELDKEIKETYKTKPGEDNRAGQLEGYSSALRDSQKSALIDAKIKKLLMEIVQGINGINVKRVEPVEPVEPVEQDDKHPHGFGFGGIEISVTTKREGRRKGKGKGKGKGKRKRTT